MGHASFLVFGAGAWGTALSLQLNKSGNEVFLSSFDEENLSAIASTRINDKYLSGVELPKEIRVTSLTQEVLGKVDCVVICVKSPYFSKALSVLNNASKSFKVLWATKGFDPDSGALLSKIVSRHYGEDAEHGVLSGPTFAEELALNKPAAITLATDTIKDPSGLASSMSNKSLRVYISNDPVGVQLGGSLKNIIAIASGISDAMDMGANARAALITRGAEEMRALGASMGANETTFSGLSGIGDLVLSATDNQSRNRQLGMHIGRGGNLDSFKEINNGAPEGVHAVSALVNAGMVNDDRFPITTRVYKILFEGLPVEVAATELMTRPLRSEN
ncbi:MAG: glycerol-3-phosphate dehydrogenase [Gammaproteobacteria bacterium]|nr:glycerol-3-phosphate dehydrogenase [Gammaproteobacteria bacterium]